jgi:DNA-binding NarL/FixJ family response regulator
MTGEIESLLGAGQEAAASGEWERAREAFAAAVEIEATPEGLYGLSNALWWLGHTDASVRAAESAYAGFRRRPDPLQAASVATRLYFLHRASLGSVATSRGWLGRARRLVDEFDLAPLAGWVLLCRAHDNEDPIESEALARQAMAEARNGPDPDLELSALSQVGASLVGQGRWDEGIALLDEAMAGALAGEAYGPSTVVYTSCAMVVACGQLAEVDRAAQWIRAADAFTEQFGNAHLFTLCRVYQGRILFAVGKWAEAEAELETAIRIGRGGERSLLGEAVAALALLRLVQGQVDAAGRLLEGFQNDAAAVVPLVGLQIANGQHAQAASLARRRVREIDNLKGSRESGYRAGGVILVEKANLLELAVVAEMARGNRSGANTAALELTRFAAEHPADVLAALAERANGRVAKDRAKARGHLERAMGAFARIDMQYETGVTQLLLAQEIAEDEPEAAVAEARGALEALEAVGASHHADEAAALLRSLGVHSARSGPKGLALLTKRETEILNLLGEGLSNRAIAERLFLTPKTVEHHVGSVLAKLEVGNRAAAAIFAVRGGEGGVAKS